MKNTVVMKILECHESLNHKVKNILPYEQYICKEESSISLLTIFIYIFKRLSNIMKVTHKSPLKNILIINTTLHSSKSYLSTLLITHVQRYKFKADYIFI